MFYQSLCHSRVLGRLFSAPYFQGMDSHMRKLLWGSNVFPRAEFLKESRQVTCVESGVAVPPLVCKSTECRVKQPKLKTCVCTPREIHVGVVHSSEQPLPCFSKSGLFIIFRVCVVFNFFVFRYFFRRTCLKPVVKHLFTKILASKGKLRVTRVNHTERVLRHRRRCVISAAPQNPPGFSLPKEETTPEEQQTDWTPSFQFLNGCCCITPLPSVPCWMLGQNPVFFHQITKWAKVQHARKANVKQAWLVK